MVHVVRDAFYVLGASILAFWLYYTFFGFYDFNDNYLADMDEAGAKWKGVLFYASDSVQSSISRYYYDYCYLPTFHSDYYVDEALGGTRSDGSTSLLEAPTDLTDDSTEYYDYSGVAHYSTGWK